LAVFCRSIQLAETKEKDVSKRAPDLTWQDSAILITIPIVVFAIFIFANYMSSDLVVSEAYQQRLPKAEVRDGGDITQLLPPDPTPASGTASQRCRVRTRDGQQEFTFKFNITGSETLKLQVGRTIQFFGEYKFDEQGGVVQAPFKGKSGRYNGWAVYENHRYYPNQKDGDL